jgi:hypothetical protein
MRKSVLYLCVAVLGFGINLSPAFADGGGASRHALRLADAHADACMYNYTQCMNGCDGMSSCEGQCQANYDGCMSQNE